MASPLRSPACTLGMRSMRAGLSDDACHKFDLRRDEARAPKLTGCGIIPRRALRVVGVASR